MAQREATPMHVQEINMLIPIAKKQADDLVAGLKETRVIQLGGFDRVWSVLFHRTMNQLTVASGLRKAYIPKNIFSGMRRGA